MPQRGDELPVCRTPKCPTTPPTARRPDSSPSCNHRQAESPPHNVATNFQFVELPSVPRLRRQHDARTLPPVATTGRLKAYPTTWRRTSSLSNSQVSHDSANSTTPLSSLSSNHRRAESLPHNVVINFQFVGFPSDHSSTAAKPVNHVVSHSGQAESLPHDVATNFQFVELPSVPRRRQQHDAALFPQCQPPAGQWPTH